MDAYGQQVCAVEALARWTLPDGTAMAPDVFIPLAEENGLIESLGNQVLRQACLDAVGWDHLVLSVNVSPCNSTISRFDEMVANVLVETGFPPSPSRSRADRAPFGERSRPSLSGRCRGSGIMASPCRSMILAQAIRASAISAAIQVRPAEARSIHLFEVVTDENAQKMIQGDRDPEFARTGHGGRWERAAAAVPEACRLPLAAGLFISGNQRGAWHSRRCSMRRPRRLESECLSLSGEKGEGKH